MMHRYVRWINDMQYSLSCEDIHKVCVKFFFHGSEYFTTLLDSTENCLHCYLTYLQLDSQNFLWVVIVWIAPSEV